MKTPWKKGILLAAVAAFIAGLIALVSDAYSYEEKLIRIQIEDRLAPLDARISEEPLEIQAQLLDYVGEGALDMKSAQGTLTVKAWLALLKYPQQTREVLNLYGTDPVFQRILGKYGEEVVPVITYFMTNDVLSLSVKEKASIAIEKVTNVIDDAVNGIKGLFTDSKAVQPPAPQPSVERVPMGPTKRGQYAISFISDEGHKFLGQFVLDSKGVAHWNQTDRAVGALSSFFVGGVSNLESKFRTDEQVKAADYFFAAVDIVPFVVAAKLARVGKVVSTSGKELGLVSKTRIFAPRLVPKSELLQRLGKFGVYAATGYVIATNPSLLNSVFRALAEALGLNPFLVQVLGWFFIVSVLMWPVSFLLSYVAKLTLLVAGALKPVRAF